MLAVLTTILPQLLKYWKEIILLLIAAILLVTTLTYKGKYEGVLNEHSSLIHQVELSNQKVLVERERLNKEQQALLASLEAEYRKSLEIKQNEITELESVVSSNNSELNRLLNTIKTSNSSATTSATSTKETTVRHINVLSELYEEALRNGAEASEEIERTKIAYTQCRGDVNSTYETVNQYNLRVNQYNVVNQYNANIENKE